MKKIMLTLALALLATTSFGAIEYEFFQKSTSEGAIVPTSDYAGRATLDGERSRVDFISGDVYPAGTYVISTDGLRRLYFVDPAKKWYTEFNMSSAASSLASSNIKISNLKSQVIKLDDVEIVAGIPTEHYQLVVTYDITVTYRTMPLTQNVRTLIDTRTTLRFGDVARHAFGATIQTGDPEIDKLIETETTKIAGFPMRQTVTITLTNASGRPVKSKLELPATRVITREMWVTSIREKQADALTFTIPATFRRADAPELPKAPPLQVLQMEPVSK